MTALMGASGAGKTTLLDVLANRKTSGVVGGTKRVNGHAITPFSFARISGFSEQEDLHMPTTTVREALAFSATLRLEADVTPAQRDAHVEEVLRMLELSPLANRLVGTLAPGELKRLTLVRQHACAVVLLCGVGQSGVAGRNGDGVSLGSQAPDAGEAACKRLTLWPHAGFVWQ
jgi:ABC-type multidrug transport system ATPase subunit